MVLENVEIQNGFRDWHFRKYAWKYIRLNFLRKLNRHLLLHKFLEQLIEKEKRVPYLNTKFYAHPNKRA